MGLEMINTYQFINSLRMRGVLFFSGVPDSLLKDFSGCLISNSKDGEHIIAANEGNAVGLAIGHYLGTGKPAVVYMQNSGLGNIINPVTSLADPDVYAIPMLLLIGWRGEPGIKDEPQHVKQGRITLAQLDTLEIPYRVLDATTVIDEVLDELWPLMMQRNGPVAIVCKKNALSSACADGITTPNNWPSCHPPLYRETAIDTVLNFIPQQSCVVATTGKTSRELYELRLKRNENQHDFLTVGGMGHTSSIALGIALAQPQRQVICIDGDGSLLMHLGAVATAGSLKCGNFVHIMLNNQAHESVGGQPTVAGGIDFQALTSACGYQSYQSAYTVEEISTAMEIISKTSGPHFIEINLWQGSRSDLGRPTSTPAENKRSVMVHLEIS